MMDVGQLMKAAQSMGMMGAPPTADGIGPRMTLALLSAIEDQSCKCEPCQQLRAIVAGMRQAAKAAMDRPADVAPPAF